MTSAADRIRASAERARRPVAAQPQPEEEQEPVVAAPAARVHEDKPRKAAVRAVPVIAPRQKDIRKNVDLSPDQNDRLGDWQRAAARELGVARVTAQDVLVALVEKLLADPDLSEQIKKDLHNTRF
ncbi:hypothetical protein QM806_34030 [Rhodococcus sp. IEGM 1351]|uniref:hypothetical protein n=1 Tax=Rhodococcus sp. IEGM 1351 TaxID=3047089 RepID=UPI0024B6F0AD|nr:hypothetical protein [Rhodococcus sp. IEGM 1351]MDI9940396.1 hypothetical protein [Rhodococcus sp. IEGM 1351]